MALAPDFRSYLRSGRAAPSEEEAAAELRPSIPYDILVEDDRTAPSSARTGANFLADAYRANLFGSAADDAAELIDDARAAAPLPVPPPTDPAAVAEELSLDPSASAAALDRVRRDFAFRNHPDRVPSEFRTAAEKRMRIANALIDTAKARLRPAKAS